MKILITTDLFRPTINGVVMSVLNLEQELLLQGHEVRILTVSDTRRSYREKNVYYMGSMPAGVFYPDIRIPVSRGKRYVGEIIQWQPDVVHSQCEFFTFGYARRISKAVNAVFLHTYHTLYEQYTQYVPIGKALSSIMVGKWSKHRLDDVNMIITPTKKVEVTLKNYGVQQDMEVVPSGICLAKFQAEVESNKIYMLKERYHIPKDKKVLLSLGRLGVEKRIEELLFGLQKILEVRKDVLLLIVGGGPEKETLQRKVKELGITDDVRFTGMVEPGEVAAYYNMGDIFVCASTSETQGLTYIEAVAGGMPLVCRKDPCLHGVLEEGNNGYSYETIEEFAESICGICESPAWKEMAKIHNGRIAAGYDTKEFGKKIENCYKEVLARKEREEYESVIVCKEPTDCVKKWSGTCYGHARRVS